MFVCFLKVGVKKCQEKSRKWRARPCVSVTYLHHSMWCVWPAGKLRCTIVIKVRYVETLNEMFVLLPALAGHRCCRHGYSLVSNFYITSCNVTAPNPQGVVCCHVTFIKLVFQCHTTAAFDITQSTFFSLSKHVLHYVFPRSTGIHFSIRWNFLTLVSSAVGSFLSVFLAFWRHNIFPIKYCFWPLFRSYHVQDTVRYVKWSFSYY